MPGQYRVTVVSGRVSRTGSALAAGGLRVTSNELTLIVVPTTKEWQESPLKAAVAVLDSSKQTPALAPDQSDRRRQAIKTLRYLGTASAAPEMARRLTGADSDWDFTAGLIGSPAREAGLAEMKKLLVDPNFPVTGRFLSAMSVLALPSPRNSEA
jgi:hypothetical protein